MENALWNFDNQLVVLRRIHDSNNQLLIDLEWTDFNIQILDLPMSQLTKDMAEFLGNTIGGFIDMDVPINGGVWEVALWLKVSVNIPKSLLRFISLKKPSGNILRAQITYEHLPNFSYLCGVIRNTEGFYGLRYDDDFGFQPLAKSGDQPCEAWRTRWRDDKGFSTHPHFVSPIASSTHSVLPGFEKIQRPFRGFKNSSHYGVGMSTSESSQSSHVGGPGGNEKIRGLLEKICETAKYLKKSPSAAQKFETAIDECNLKDKRKVAMDVPNSWNSIYELLETALPLKEAICRLQRIDKQYMFNPSESEWDVVTVHDTLKDLFFTYGGSHVSSTSDRAIASSSNTCTDDNHYERWFDQNRGLVNQKSEGETYLDEPRYPKIENFSILDWWGTSNPRLPILAKIARDVLVVPATTVASEAAFSDGDRVIDESCASLHPNMVEAFVVADDWIRPVSIKEGMRKVMRSYAKQMWMVTWK
ncbi:hypothetical protein BUALT_Bualt10G0007900 [Buddleja alternifolia]|uniref:HAT C-terminal dimerisation domain-containing protein n=1 Tax=Buddleja alternifolia TaxID=168488 RepID=A0AAV6X5X1_9LAMI|nr:hypothetical protein BUALT_Bualt10G0007900 [Buddleja alternifolia]